MVTPPKAVHFGAGAIGRGFVGPLLHGSGYHTVFIDVDDKVVKWLNNLDFYSVIELCDDSSNNETRLGHVTNFRALNPASQAEAVIKEIATADLVTCSVGVPQLSRIAPLVAQGIKSRSLSYHLIVIACENAVRATSVLQGHVEKIMRSEREGLVESDDVLHRRVLFADAAVDRIVPTQPKEGEADWDRERPLDVLVGEFYEWVVEVPPVVQRLDHGPVVGAKYVKRLEPYIERKLWTLNAAHAAAAYYGSAIGCQTIAEVMQLDDVRKTVEKVIAETGKLLVARHLFDPAEHAKYRAKIIQRISQRGLGDSVGRVGRGVLRKLKRDERLIGPALQCAKRGMQFQDLLSTIELAFGYFDVEGDEESRLLGVLLATGEPEDIVELVCGVEPEEMLYGYLVDVVDHVQRRFPEKLMRILDETPADRLVEELVEAMRGAKAGLPERFSRNIARRSWRR